LIDALSQHTELHSMSFIKSKLWKKLSKLPYIF